MRRNIYRKQYEYPDPSKGYEQSTDEEIGPIGYCVEQIIYRKGLGNHAPLTAILMSRVSWFRHWASLGRG
jgi:hypothetical protein